MKIFFILITGILVSAGCNFSKSVQKDLTTGLITKGNGLTCDNVYLSENDEKINHTTFVYGQKFNMVFDNIRGFKKENGNVFPGMVICVTGEAGDTVMRSKDLYEQYADGLDISPLLLYASVTAAAPMRSGNNYIMHVNIKDKRGAGTFSGEVKFRVVSNEVINIETKGVTYDEVYLYSKERDMVIPENAIKFNETVYLIFEGLNGFTETNGNVFPGLALKAVDSDDNIILDYDDLFKGLEESGVSASDFQTRISSHFILDPGQLKNPLNLDVTVWDKKSDASIKAKAALVIE